MVRPIVQMRPDRCRYCDVGYAALAYTLEEAVKKGFNVTDLGGDLATRVDLERLIAEKAPLFFHAVGHGNVDVFTGQDMISVLQVGVNEGILAGMIVYLLSCYTGVELGPAIIAAGGWAYIGYTVAWTWMEADGGGDPFADKYARGFFDGSNTIPIAILNGLTVEQARQAGIAKYTEWIDYWAASDDPYASSCVEWLIHDRDNCERRGDPGAGLDVVTHLLTVNSDPSNAMFHVDGIGGVTPETKSIIEGFHTLSVPNYQWINGVPYGIDHWEDGSVDRIREINLTADTTLTAYLKELPTHSLTVNSDPVSGIPFNIDGLPYATPYSETFLEGGYTIAMPADVIADGIKYRFLEWEDGTTNSTRTVNLTADTTLTAYYIAVYLVEFLSEPALGVTLLVNGVEHITPITVEMDEGTYALKAPFSFVANGVTFTFVKWEDGSTELTRTVTIIGDAKIVAYYKGKGTTPFGITLTERVYTISTPEIITV